MRLMDRAWRVLAFTVFGILASFFYEKSTEHEDGEVHRWGGKKLRFVAHKIFWALIHAQEWTLKKYAPPPNSRFEGGTYEYDCCNRFSEGMGQGI